MIYIFKDFTKNFSRLSGSRQQVNMGIYIHEMLQMRATLLRQYASFQVWQKFPISSQVNLRNLFSWPSKTWVILKPSQSVETATIKFKDEWLPCKRSCLKITISRGMLVATINSEFAETHNSKVTTPVNIHTTHTNCINGHRPSLPGLVSWP